MVFYKVTHKGILQGYRQRYSTRLLTKVFYKVTHKGILQGYIFYVEIGFAETWIFKKYLKFSHKKSIKTKWMCKIVLFMYIIHMYNAAVNVNKNVNTNPVSIIVMDE